MRNPPPDMPRRINNIALAGADGTIGSQILKALVANSSFTVTVLTRRAEVRYSESVIVKVVDFESAVSLVEDLAGQDAVIDAMGNPDPIRAMRLMDAAAAAGVYRFVPAEFGGDPENTQIRSLPVFQGQTQAFEHLKKLAADKKLTFTAISNGAFLDWCLRTGFLGIDLAGNKIELFGDGTVPFPWTQVSSVGNAVANALARPERTENRICRVYNIQKSQEEMATLVQETLGADNWEIRRLDMIKVYDDAMAAVKAGNVSAAVMMDLIRYSVSTPDYGSPVKPDDNELLNVESMSDADVQLIIKRISNETRAFP